MNTTLPAMSLGLLGATFAETIGRANDAIVPPTDVDFDDELTSALGDEDAKDAKEAKDAKDATPPPPPPVLVPLVAVPLTPFAEAENTAPRVAHGADAHAAAKDKDEEAPSPAPALAPPTPAHPRGSPAASATYAAKLDWNGTDFRPVPSHPMATATLAHAIADRPIVEAPREENVKIETRPDMPAEPVPVPVVLEAPPPIVVPSPTPIEPAVKTMTAPDAAPEMPSEHAREAVRIAESLGHKRVLASGEARGQIVVPELGRVDVRAHTHAVAGVEAVVQVNVQVDDPQGRAVVVQHAPELRAHVHAEIPNANVHLDQRGNGGHSERRGTGGHEREACDESAQDDGESAVQRQIPRRRGAARYVL